MLQIDIYRPIGSKPTPIESNALEEINRVRIHGRIDDVSLQQTATFLTRQMIALHSLALAVSIVSVWAGINEALLAKFVSPITLESVKVSCDIACGMCVPILLLLWDIREDNLKKYLPKFLPEGLAFALIPRIISSLMCHSPFPMNGMVVACFWVSIWFFSYCSIMYMACSVFYLDSQRNVWPFSVFVALTVSMTGVYIFSSLTQMDYVYDHNILSHIFGGFLIFSVVCSAVFYGIGCIRWIRFLSQGKVACCKMRAIKPPSLTFDEVIQSSQEPPVIKDVLERQNRYYTSTMLIIILLYPAFVTIGKFFEHEQMSISFAAERFDGNIFFYFNIISVSYVCMIVFVFAQRVICQQAIILKDVVNNHAEVFKVKRSNMSLSTGEEGGSGKPGGGGGGSLRHGEDNMSLENSFYEGAKTPPKTTADKASTCGDNDEDEDEHVYEEDLESMGAVNNLLTVDPLRHSVVGMMGPRFNDRLTSSRTRHTRDTDEDMPITQVPREISFPPTADDDGVSSLTM